MIIGIDASRANKQEKTGTEWYAYHIIQEIKRLADPHDQFILYSKEGLLGDLALLPENFSSRVLSWPPKFLWTQLRLAWEMIWHSPDALFVPAHTIPIFHPKNTTTTLHDVGFERYSHLYSDKFIGPKNAFLKTLLLILVKIFTLGKYGTTELDYHRWSARLAVHGAKKIITVSDFSKNEIVHFYNVPERKITVIPNAPNPNYRKITDSGIIERTLQKFHISSSYFLYIGRLEEKKNTATLIKAFDQYHQKTNNSMQLLLVGQPGYGYANIKKLLLNEKIKNYIKELGWINAEDLPPLMNAATAFVFPSAYEGFGIPIIEAMQAGTPVITSNHGAMKEVAGSSAFLIDSDNPGSLASALEKITNDQGLRTNLIAKGFKHAASYSWKKSAADTLKLILSS